MLYKKVLILLLCVISFALAACNFMEERENWVITSESYEDLDNLLAKVIENQGLSVLDMNQIPDNDLIQLGQALFFDKILSGNQDISCASCHHPAFSGGDALPIAIGTGGSGLGSNRKLGQDRNLIPRNSPEIFNRGASDWESMFWDSRVAVALDGVFISPAAEELPEGLNSVLSVQAMFPVTSRDEMRGYISDGDNELSLINDDDLPAIWQAIMSRLLSKPKYVQLFSAAYPDVPTNELGFQHAANAIAAFEIASFTFADSPWDRYLAGDHGVLSDNAKQGALLFYGEAGCSQCHSGSLMSDQEHHNICVPQLGPGKDESGLDYGRYLETGDPQDKFAFRTPPLRNVALTGPWMHNGAYTRLEDAVRHHFNAAEYLADYTGEHLPEQFKQTLQNDAELIAEIMATLDPLLVSEPEISSEEFDQLMAFLLAQTSPSALNLAYLVPDTVPSGLPIRE